MAGGTFEKDVEKVRPGTYINYVDAHNYSADASGGDASGIMGAGGSGSWKVKDYHFGKEYEAVVEAAGTPYKASYPVAEDGSGAESMSGDENILKEVV